MEHQKRNGVEASSVKQQNLNPNQPPNQRNHKNRHQTPPQIIEINKITTNINPESPKSLKSASTS